MRAVIGALIASTGIVGIAALIFPNDSVRMIICILCLCAFGVGLQLIALDGGKLDRVLEEEKRKIIP